MREAEKSASRPFFKYRAEERLVAIMFEITVIEHYPNGETSICHLPFNDDEDEFIEQLINDENKCVEAGVLLSYSTITHYERWNNVRNYCNPSILAIP